MADEGQPVCAVVGASHGGVNFAFALRQEGWTGRIVLIDADPELPYHRPPLSKGFLKGETDVRDELLRAEDAYERSGIELQLGITVEQLDRTVKSLRLSDGRTLDYDRLVLATGGTAFFPPVPGLSPSPTTLLLRSAADARLIRKAATAIEQPRVVVIGGGYIGLEAAAALRQTGADVTVIEREERILARVAPAPLAAYYHELHEANGVKLLTGQEVVAVEADGQSRVVMTDQGTRIPADVIIVGVGIRPSTALAKAAGLEADYGIAVDHTCRTSDPDIFAIGDCTLHQNGFYDKVLRIESVQHAVDQGKVAAAAIMGKAASYRTVPWFWSDQYDRKLQIVGLADGADEHLVRREAAGDGFSVWSFREGVLVSVQAVNNPRAYMLGMKALQNNLAIDREKLNDTAAVLRPGLLLK